MQSNEIESLSQRIASLELDNKNLKREIRHLKSTISKHSNTSVKNRSKPKEVNSEYERANKGIFLDRYERNLELGDEVYILTSGAHTDKSRNGTVTGFDNYRNRVFVLDEQGVTQERAPKNLRLESRISK